MSISLAGLDMPVLVPAGVPLRSLRVLAAGRGSAPGNGPLFFEDVSVGPAGTSAEGVPPWSVRTIARRGIRPTPDGSWTHDGNLRGIAETAVTSLLLKLIPYGSPAEETLRGTAQAGAVGRDVAARMEDPGTWPRTTMDVDGHSFVLWLHRRTEGFAAVADLGPCRVVLHGMRPPPSWRFSLLSAEDARAGLGG